MPNYVGNDDFRGHLNYLGQQGDNYANAWLNYVGGAEGANPYTVNRDRLDNDVRLAPNQMYGYGSSDRALGALSDYYYNYTNPSGGGGGGGSGGSGGSGSAGPDYSNEIAKYNNDITGYDKQLGLLGGLLSTGQANLDTSRNDRVNTVNDDYARSVASYNTQKGDTLQDRTSSVNSSLSQSSSRLNALQRLLGSRGAGNSSAALVAAPQAVAREGSSDLKGIQRTYGRNLRNLDYAKEETDKNKKDVLGQIKRSREIEGNNLQADIKQKRADLLDKKRSAAINRDLLSGTSYDGAAARYSDMQSNIDTLLSQIAGLGRQPNIPTIGKVGYSAPSLADYVLASRGNITDTPQNQGVNPLLTPIIEEEETV